jgi:hypothetical protein
MNTSSHIAPTFGEVEMKLVMSTAVAAVVLTFLATGLAEAEKNDCTKVRHVCIAEVHGGDSPFDHWVDRAAEGTYFKVSECMRARGCVPHYPSRPIDWDWRKRNGV